MFFSVVVPVYNVKVYLRQCIESVLKQSQVDFELILVDDGSTDGSGLICDEYSNDWRVHVIHQENGGVAKARNTGISVAKGTYVLFLDADDYWKFDSLSEIKKKIVSEECPDFVFVQSEFREFHNGEERVYSAGFASQEFDCLSGESTLEYLLKNSGRNLFSVWRGIFKRNIILENQVWFEPGITLGEDADWLFRFVLYSNTSVLVDNPFYVYRVDRVGSAMSVKSLKALQSYLRVVNKWITSYVNHPTDVGKLICTKLSNNYVEYLGYVYFLQEAFRETLITQIKESNLLGYVDSSLGIKVNLAIGKLGFNRGLLALNLILRAQRAAKYTGIRVNDILSRKTRN